MEWINVKDRLPTKMGSYLVCIPRGSRVKMKVAAFNASANQKTPHFYGNQTFTAKEITYWMPLPEPPT